MTIIIVITITILLLPVAAMLAKRFPSSYINRYKAEIAKGFARAKEMDILTEGDIAGLPAPLQRYIRYSGAIGKPRIQNFHAVLEGNIRLKQTAEFMHMHAEQCNFFDEPTRVFYIESKMRGIPFDGLHLYKGSNATMQIRIASLFKITDASGPKMTQSETVTLFNDMCLMAPSTLIDQHIKWEEVDALTARARFSNAGYTISATLYFNDKSELINFSSDDRYMSADGKTYLNYRWTTPIRDYKDFRGRKVASYGSANWHTPEGEFCYGIFRTKDIEYNCRGRP